MQNFNFTARIHLFTKQPPNAKCVEVGTRYGDLALEVVNARPDIDLIVVDSWEGKFADGKEICRAKLGDRARILNHDSTLASKFIAPESLDLVYIDAAHDYANVTADLKAWWPKVKRGGIMAWHDHENKPDDGFWGPIEVLSAVTDWAGELGLKINIVEPYSCPSGWVVKP